MVYFHGGNFQIGQAEEYLGSQLLFYIGKFMKYGRLDSAIGPDEAPWPAWKPKLQLEGLKPTHRFRRKARISSPAAFSITAFSAVSGTPGTGTRPIRC